LLLIWKLLNTGLEFCSASAADSYFSGSSTKSVPILLLKKKLLLLEDALFNICSLS